MSTKKRPQLNSSIMDTLKPEPVEFKPAESSSSAKTQKPSSAEPNHIDQINQISIDIKSPAQKKANETRKGRMEDTHTRTTFLIDNNLRNQFLALADQIGGKGIKTVLANEAIYHFLTDKEHLQEVVAKLSAKN